MVVKGIHYIAGKTIERVIVKQSKIPHDHPGVQVFLVFTDQTYYEIYADMMGFTGSVYIGGRDSVLKYLSDSMTVVHEGYLDEEGRPTYK